MCCSEEDQDVLRDIVSSLREVQVDEVRMGLSGTNNLMQVYCITVASHRQHYNTYFNIKSIKGREILQQGWHNLLYYISVNITYIGTNLTLLYTGDMWFHHIPKFSLRISPPF